MSHAMVSNLTPEGLETQGASASGFTLLTRFVQIIANISCEETDGVPDLSPPVFAYQKLKWHNIS